MRIIQNIGAYMELANRLAPKKEVVEMRRGRDGVYVPVTRTVPVPPPLFGQLQDLSKKIKEITKW